MDGFVATQKIRALERSDSLRRRTKIYALTAHAGDLEKEKAIRAGMDVVLTKPVSQSALREALNVEF
jgi:CheY-like chemotaxis protein